MSEQLPPGFQLDAPTGGLPPGFILDQPPAPSWSEIPGQALANAPSSALNMVESVAHPFLHPIQTAESFYDLGKGLASKVGLLSQAPEDKASNEAAVNAVGHFFAGRYGSIDNLKRTLATDPVGVLADATIVLTGGELAGARLPGMVGSVARAAGTVGRAIDPMAAAGKIATPIARGVGRAASLPLALSSGTAPRNIIMAGKAGLEGNDTFASQMRGLDDINQPVEMADSALKQIGIDRSTAYNAGMSGVRADTTMLDFTPINKAVDDAEGMVSFEGVPISDQAAGVWSDIKSKVDNWQTQPPQFDASGNPFWPHHTPEGLDKLKQSIGEIRQKTDPGTLERKVADSVYNSIKTEVAKQAPDYAATMQDYSDASEKLQGLRKTFSLREGMTDDTKLRKLQSTMRDNVNTNFGSRTKLLDMLATKEPDLPYALAGQGMNTWLPRGQARLATNLAALGATGATLATGNLPAAAGLAGTLAATSPRLIGETAYVGGRGLKALQKVGRPMGLGAYQLGRLPLSSNDNPMYDNLMFGK